MKNPTPQILSLYSALIMTGFNLLFSVLTGVHWFDAIIYIVATFLLGFSTFFYFLNFLIYRKIKVIYKIINRHKAGKFTEFRFQYNNDVIDAVSKDVEEWAENKAKEIQELQSNEQYRKEFVGNLSHELKTPVFNIQGYLSTLVDRGLEDPKVTEKFLEKAIENTERMEAIINDLMEISKLESGNVQLKWEKFDLAELMEDVFHNLQERAERKHISIQFKQGLKPPFLVYADRKLINHAVMNLVENAIKYGKENGNVLVGIYDMDTHYMCEVTDDGEGIDEIHHSRIFERFYRVDKARSRDAGGTGLGLSIVKHIFESHSQTVWVRSTKGIGTTFAFTLKKK